MSVPAIRPDARAALAAAPPRDTAQALRTQSRALESLFLNQLFQAMRASVPRAEEGGDSAAELFDSWLDERVAQLAAERSTRGPGEAMYRQLVPQPGDRP